MSVLADIACGGAGIPPEVALPDLDLSGRVIDRPALHHQLDDGLKCLNSPDVIERLSLKIGQHDHLKNTSRFSTFARLVLNVTRERK